MSLPSNNNNNNLYIPLNTENSPTGKTCLKPISKINTEYN